MDAKHSVTTKCVEFILGVIFDFLCGLLLISISVCCFLILFGSVIMIAGGEFNVWNIVGCVVSLILIWSIGKLCGPMKRCKL